ncbi:type II secretion system protein GspM [Gilvimarinus polysaccharolyticus]|uniref:type II secretion system protein GspM n=1 Tax=Gilvimarinus polysaccharolyticus TaxID=863921 RepID=UPI0006735602|nr:type II secretion system protein GspM [Gilvimarinus polysaccharolyticus]
MSANNRFNLSGFNPSQWLVVSALALVVTVTGIVGVSLLASAYQLQQNKSRLVPQIARLKGLVATEQDIATAAQAAADTLGQLTYSDQSEPGALANNMQQSMRELFVEAGLTVSGSQVLPAVKQTEFTRIRVRLTASGGVTSLTDILIMLADQNPIVVIDSIEVKPRRRRKLDEGQELSVTVVLSSFMQVSG